MQKVYDDRHLITIWYLSKLVFISLDIKDLKIADINIMKDCVLVINTSECSTGSKGLCLVGWSFVRYKVTILTIYG